MDLGRQAKVAIVAGASCGIGRAAALTLTAEDPVRLYEVRWRDGTTEAT